MEYKVIRGTLGQHFSIFTEQTGHLGIWLKCRFCFGGWSRPELLRLTSSQEMLLLVPRPLQVDCGGARTQQLTGTSCARMEQNT